MTSHVVNKRTEQDQEEIGWNMPPIKNQTGYQQKRQVRTAQPRPAVGDQSPDEHDTEEDGEAVGYETHLTGVQLDNAWWESMCASTVLTELANTTGATFLCHEGAGGGHPPTCLCPTFQ